MTIPITELSLVDLLLNIPVSIRLAFLFLLGAVVGGQINRGIFRLAWNPREIGPWSAPPPDVPDRSWLDRLPLLGWLHMRREAVVHGSRFWIRPALIELFTAAGFAGLYWLEVQQLILWPAGWPGQPDSLTLHAQYFSHITLISLMMVATFIDLDEQTIPDEITLLGTVLGVTLVAALPWSLLPSPIQPAYQAPSLHRLVLTSSNLAENWRSGWGGPASWPVILDGPRGLLIAGVAIWAWCLAVMHKTWTLRQGLVKAVQYLVASVRRRGSWIVPLVLGSFMSLVVLAAWSVGGKHWEAALSSVVGMAGGGALIWSVRIVGGRALNMEAMGFGDVTLMSMIGAFLGWQPTFLIFFMAPFSALFIALAQWILSGNRHIAFGPYLCLSTLILLIGWNAIWTNWACPMFSFGWFIPAIFACCLVLMGGLLSLWRIIRDALFCPTDEDWEEQSPGSP